MTAFRRAPELGLLLLAVALLGVGLVQVSVVRGDDNARAWLIPALVFCAALVVTHTALSARLAAADQVLLPITAALGAVGLVVIFRLQPALALRQSAWMLVGLVACVVVALGLPSVDWLKRYKYTCAALGLGLVGTTFLLGIDPNGSGARLWLGVGGVYFQPSEVFKVLLVVFFAAYLDEYHELLTFGGRRFGPLALPPLPYLLPLLAMLGVALAVLVWQRDLGAALLFFGIFLALLYAASGNLLSILLGMVGFLAAASVAYRLFDHVRLRVDVWLDPWAQAQTGGFQVVQALMALAAGGVLGTGLGYGIPEVVPAAHTDFVIAAVGEELGLVGSLGLVALYSLLVHRAFRIALGSPNTFAMLLATGLGSVLAIQTLIILGGTLRLIPLTGITLPLVSYGGSSIAANCLMVGLLLRISDESGRVVGEG